MLCITRTVPDSIVFQVIWDTQPIRIKDVHVSSNNYTSIPQSLLPSFNIILVNNPSYSPSFTDTSSITYKYTITCIHFNSTVITLPIKNPALEPSANVFMCCWHAYTTASNWSDESLTSSITLSGNFKSKYTCGGSTLARELRYVHTWHHAINVLWLTLIPRQDQDEGIPISLK